jgi:magnesium chelatase family protein
VIDARRRQDARQGHVNARLAGRELERACKLDDRAAESLLERAAARFQLSARGIARVLRVARTIADLSTSPIVTHEHLAEALQFRTEVDA